MALLIFLILAQKLRPGTVVTPVIPEVLLQFLPACAVCLLCVVSDKSNPKSQRWHHARPADCVIPNSISRLSLSVSSGHLQRHTMLLWLTLRLVCVVFVFSSVLPLSSSSSSFTENLTIRPLKNGNMLVDVSFHMEHILKKRCAQWPPLFTTGNITMRPSVSCVSQSSGASQELAQLYTLSPAEVP